jgi:hypothetical protein
LLAAGFLAVMSLGYEWPAIALLKSRNVIAGYPFGAEGPVAGDWRYARADRYGWSALFFGLAAATTAVLFWLSWRRTSWRLLALSVIAAITTLRGVDLLFRWTWTALHLP